MMALFQKRPYILIFDVRNRTLDLFDCQATLAFAKHSIPQLFEPNYIKKEEDAIFIRPL